MKAMLNMLGLCARAGKLVTGEKACVQAIRAGSAFVALLDGAASANAVKAKNHYFPPGWEIKNRTSCFSNYLFYARVSQTIKFYSIFRNMSILHLVMPCFFGQLAIS